MDRLEHYLRLRVVCADPEAVFSKLAENGVDILNLKQLDLLTNEFTIYKRHLKTVQVILGKSGGSCHEVSRNGIVYSFVDFLHRPVLFVSFVLFFVLLFLTSDRIFFFKVVGNEKIRTELILSHAQMYGMEFGVKAADMRSEELKNALLSSFPQLQWLGVTTKGSVATIHVTERSIPEKGLETDGMYPGICAARDGIISSIIIERGTPLVQVGQRVKEGDLLISGYSDCGIKIRAEEPSGEVFAYTVRNLTVLTPRNAMFRASTRKSHSCYKVRFGKKVINLCNHSGIHDTSCVKMYEEYYWTLPGGFHLPVAVIKVSSQQHELVPADMSEDTQPWLERYVRMYLQTQMIAGEILDEILTWDNEESIQQLRASYACREMIGQRKNEETFDHYAEDN